VRRPRWQRFRPATWARLGACSDAFTAADGCSPGSGSGSRRCCGRRVWTPRSGALAPGSGVRLPQTARAPRPASPGPATRPVSVTRAGSVRPRRPCANTRGAWSARPVWTAPRTGPRAWARRVDPAVSMPTATLRTNPSSVRCNTVSPVGAGSTRRPGRRTPDRPSPSRRTPDPSARPFLDRRARVVRTPTASSPPDPRVRLRSAPACPAPRRSRAARGFAAFARGRRGARRWCAVARPVSTCFVVSLRGSAPRSVRPARARAG
jgi:hypothetical protein